MNKGKIEQVGTPEEVYHKPATVFVLNFLGNVNLFHGRVIDGKMYLAHEVPEAVRQSEVKTANLYIRPHQFDISRDSKGENSIKTVIKYINPAGAVVKLDLMTRTGHSIQAEITKKEFADLKLVKGEEVFCSPKNITFCEYEI